MALRHLDMFARGVADLTTARSATASSGIGNESVLEAGTRATIHASESAKVVAAYHHRAQLLVTVL